MEQTEAKLRELCFVALAISQIAAARRESCRGEGLAQGELKIERLENGVRGWFEESGHLRLN